MQLTEAPPELQKKLDRLKITWAWLALAIGPLCIGAAFFLFVEAWRGPGTAYWEENYVYEPAECKKSGTQTVLPGHVVIVCIKTMTAFAGVNSLEVMVDG